MPLDYPPAPRERAPLRPTLALTSPTWLAALAVLLVNDHLLKGADILPGPITGKLSDFAGMLVAPALLAALLRVRERRALLACHVAVGAVFAAINLSPQVAALWSALMGAIAVPWVITVDPTDLVALPVLGLSYALFRREMQSLPGAPTRRLVESGAMSMGLIACVATSEGGGWEDSIDATGGWSDGDFTPITADVYINNASESEDLVIRVRELANSVTGLCGFLAEDPGQLVTDPLLGQATTWTLPPGTNAAIRDTSRAADCHAVLIEIDGLPPAMAFWLNGQITLTEVEGRITESSQHEPGAIIVDRDELGFAAYRAETPEILFQVATEPSELSQTPTCEALSDGRRLEWTKTPSGIKRLTHVDNSPDGCLGLHLDDGEGELPPDAESTPVDWYLCMPPEIEFPFAAGDSVSITEVNGFGDSPRVTLELVIDPENPEHTESVSLVLGTGSEPPFVSGTTMDFVRADECGPVVEETCGTVVHRGELAARFLGDEQYTLAVGTSVTLGDASESVELHVPYAEDRLVFNSDCAAGPQRLGPDLEVVAIHRAAL